MYLGGQKHITVTMRSFFIALLSILAIPCAYAQKVEVAVQANAGLFQYSGNATASTSFINSAGGDPLQGNVNNPYGNKNGFSYGGDIQVQYVSRGGFIAGVQGGYDVLRSIVAINSVSYPYFYDEGPGYEGMPAKGQTALQNQDININPYIGYRLNLKKIKIDIMPGMDFGFNVSSYDKGTATTTDGSVYKLDNKMPKSATDVRLRMGLAAGFKRFGLTAGYAYGLTNFASNLDVNAGGTSTPASKAHSKLIRFGISYRIF
jgi:hypothetical protein